MPGLFCLAIFLLSLTFFVGAYFLSSTLYFKKHDVKYSFKRMFPYEFNYPNAFRNNVYGNVAFVISYLGTITFYIYYLSTHASDSVPLIALSVSAVIMAVLIACLSFMPLQFLRAHMIVSSTAMVLSFAMPALGAMLCYETFKHVTTNSDKSLCVVALVVGAIIALVMFVLLLNPRATYKIYLDKSVDKDGNEVLMRPKFIPIAFNEWWAIFTYILSPIPLLIISFIK